VLAIQKYLVFSAKLEAIAVFAVVFLDYFALESKHCYLVCYGMLWTSTFCFFFYLFFLILYFFSFEFLFLFLFIDDEEACDIVVT